MGTKIKYDVSDVEAGQDFDTPVPVGLYRCTVSEIEDTVSQSSGNQMLAVTMEISKGEFKGRKLWDYIVLTEAAAWKLRQFLEAIGEVNGKKAKGTLDIEAVIGSAVMAKVKHETDNRDPENPVVRARVGSLLPVPDSGASDDDLDDDEPEDDDEPDYDYESLAECSRAELEEIIEDEDLDVSFRKNTKDEVLLERVAEALGVEEEEEEEEDEDEEEPYDEWSTDELRAACAERGIKKTGTKKQLIARLEKDDEEDDDDGNEPF
jgi:hypothetical protein